MNRVFLGAFILSAVPMLAEAQPATGLYVGGAGGANFLQNERVDRATIGSTSIRSGHYSFDPGIIGLGSVGYGFGNGFRVEVEGDYRHNGVSNASNVMGASSIHGREQKYGPMVNGLFDLDIGMSWIFPYFGVGAGYQWTHLSEEIAGSGAEAFRGGTDGRFAYQAIAGASFPLAPVPGLSLTAEYRFMGLAGDHDLGGYRLSGCASSCAAGSPATSNVRVAARLDHDFNHGLLIGLRYAFDTAPPPPVAPVPAVMAPAPELARTYLVFFDWDRADLSDRAREVVADAAQASMRVQTTRIAVNGYTDRSGTAPYNLGLSVRRARTVESELVRDGVPRQAIRVKGFGEDNPLVATSDGAREAQNRRVEIVLR